MVRHLLGVMALLLVSVFPGPVHSFAVQRDVASGKRTLMWRYGNYKTDCSPESGVVKVLSKPQHGKLSPSREMITIRLNRFNTAIGSKCVGKQIPGFVVYYTSAPGFSGTDTFKIEMSHPNHPPDVDTFSVNVR